ncbi:MAG: general secretion pathway protein GspB [Pirellulales bacterium]|nr:general secretion pathway protein GspB [Pirellulales bacterium]
MKSSELWQASLRDLKRNPRKALMLGLLAAVALYFWVPLVSGWLGRGGLGASSSTNAMGLSNTTETAAPTDDQPTFPWKAVAAAMRECPWSRPLTELSLARDPFAVPAKPVAEPAAPVVDLDLQAATTAGNDPDSLGLYLSGTIVGAGSRTATINGRVYRLGDRVLAQDDSLWTVVEIGARYVLLDRRGTVVKIKMQPSAAEKMRTREELTDPPAG